MKKKNFWPFYFFFLGLISLLAQVVLLREISNLFYGNELFYGLGLGFWLLLVGLGSWLAGKLKNLPAQFWVLGLLLLAWAVLVPFWVVGLRWLVANLVLPGALPDWGFSLGVLGAILFIFCLPLGAFYTWGSLSWRQVDKKVFNQPYFWETIGFFGAGLLFSFFLATTSFPLAKRLNLTSLSWRYPNLVKVINSPYQSILVSQDQEQESFFLGGQLAFSNQEEFANQQLLSSIPPFLKAGQKVLVLGSPGLATALEELLPQAEIFFLEIDSELLDLEKELLSEEIKPVVQDPRNFLNQTNQSFDLILFAPGHPQTLLTNRLYTQEAFSLIKKQLTPAGIFALIFYLPIDYQSQEALRFAGSIYQTLKTTFPYLQLMTPEEQLFFLASKSSLSVESEKIIPRWQEYFSWQKGNLQAQEILTRLAKTKEELNTDSKPVAFFYQQLFWQTIFSFKTPLWLAKAAYLFPLALLFTYLFFLLKGKGNLRLGLLAASSSFLLLSLEIVIIFLFQTQIGNLYQQLALIFASVLLGMGLGIKLIKKINFWAWLVPLFLVGVASHFPTALVDQPLFWFFLALMTGLVGGGVFARLNRTFLQKNKHTGFIYAFDLFGGFFGAILTTSFLLPLLGLKGLVASLVIIVMINLLASQKI